MANIPYNLVAEGWAEGAARVREFSGALEDAQGKADQFGESADEAEGAGSSFASSLEGLAGFATTAAGGIAAAAAAAIAWGDATERSMGVFNRMPGSVREAQDAVGGMVSRMDLAIARNLLMQAGLELTDTQFANVAEVATDYAAAVGDDATQAMQQLGDALRTGSAEGLGRFGISVDATRSKAEQFSQAMVQLRQRSDEMETGADTAGGAWGHFKTIIDDAMTEAERATDVITQQGLGFDDLARAITGSSSASVTWQDVSRTTEDIFTGLVAAVGAGAEALVVAASRAVEGWRSFFRLISEGFDEIRSGRFDFSAALARVSAGQQNIRGNQSILDIFNEALDRNLRAIVDDPRARGGGNRPEPTGNIRLPGRTPRSGRSGSRDLRTGAQQVEDMLAEQQGAEEAQRALEAMNRAANEAGLSARFALDQWTEGLDKTAEATRRLNDEQEDLAEHQKGLTDQANEAARTFRDSWRQGVDAVIAALDEANEAARKAGTAQVDAMEAAGQAALAASAQMGDALLGGIANAFAGAAKAAITGQKSFGEALAGMLEDTLFSIGTQAIVLSVFEFARAIADAASLNAAGAAGHAAAGVAFAAVAALAFAGGAGLAAANPSAAASAGAGSSSSPASPAPANDNGGGGTTNIYNITFGGQVVTASTHAELGRQLESSINQGRARWGRAA